MSAFVILIPPAFDAVSLSEIRAYLRIGSDADNATLSILQKAAIFNVEIRNNRALAKRKLRQSFTSQDIESAFRVAQKMGGAVYLRPAFSPNSISEVRIIGAGGNFVINNTLVAIEANKLKLTNFAEALEIDYFAGSETISDVPNELKLEVLEEVARLIAIRDNEKSQNPASEVRL